MAVEIVDFKVEMLAEAARLLAHRHARDRGAYPALPERFQDPAQALELVEAVWKKQGAAGAAAVRRGELIGYLIGDVVTEAPWERSGWVRLAGCALAPGESLEILPDVYAKVGARWVDHGCFAHFAMISTADPAWVEAWFRLSFGVEQVHALLSLTEDPSRQAPTPKGVEIRRAGPGDAEALGRLSTIIGSELVREPVWAARLPESLAQTRAGWAELPADPEAVVWLGFEAGQAVASQGYYPAASSVDPLLAPQDCLHLTVAAALDEARGRGIGQALAREAFAWARKSGQRYCHTDFRSANRSASRFLSRQGFHAVAYRLVRRIDSRIAWARGAEQDG